MRDLCVKRQPEYGWAVFDRSTGEKVLPAAPSAWFATRGRAIQAKNNYQYRETPAVIVAGDGVGARPHVESDVQALVNDLANRYEDEGHARLAAEAKVEELESDLRLANEATLILVERAATAEREVDRYKGLLDEAKGYIAALEEELRAIHDDGPDCLCIGDE